MTNTKERTMDNCSVFWTTEGYDDVAIAEAIHMANLEYDYDLVEELIYIRDDIEELIDSGDTSSDEFFELLKEYKRLTN